jgi:hypothetical protein
VRRIEDNLSKKNVIFNIGLRDVDSKMIIEPLCEKYVRRGILFDKSFILKK